MQNGRLLGAPQEQVAQLCTPMNDIQVMAFIASRRIDLTPKEAVAWAGDILVEAVVQSKHMSEKIRQKLTEA